MSETLEWRKLYGARETLFVEGIGVGDYYPTTSGAYDNTFNEVEDAFVTKLSTG